MTTMELHKLERARVYTIVVKVVIDVVRRKRGGEREVEGKRFLGQPFVQPRSICPRKGEIEIPS